MTKLDSNSILLRLLHIPNTIECGRHSGFPPCCIKFYITTWMWELNKGYKHPHWKSIRKLEKELKQSINYIPCPDCITNKTIIPKSLRCPKGSHCFHGDECAGS